MKSKLLCRFEAKADNNVFHLLSLRKSFKERQHSEFSTISPPANPSKTQ